MQQYPPVRGMASSLFFWSHDHPEGGAADESKSKYNDEEAKMAVRLAKHLLLQVSSKNDTFGCIHERRTLNPLAILINSTGHTQPVECFDQRRGCKAKCGRERTGCSLWRVAHNLGFANQNVKSPTGLHGKGYERMNLSDVSGVNIVTGLQERGNHNPDALRGAAAQAAAAVGALHDGNPERPRSGSDPGGRGVASSHKIDDLIDRCAPCFIGSRVQLISRHDP